MIIRDYCHFKFNKRGRNMKKIGLICATALLGMSLTACGSQSTKKASSSSKTSSSKVVKHHKKANKHSEKKQESASSNSSSVAGSSSQQATNQQAQGNNNQQASVSNICMILLIAMVNHLLPTCQIIMECHQNRRYSPFLTT